MPRAYGSTNLQSYAAAPAVGAEGSQYWDSVLDKAFVSNGAAWVELSNSSHTHPSTSDYNWIYDSSAVMADPGGGDLRTDTAAGTPATQIAFSDLTEFGIDASGILKSLAVGDLIYFQQRDNADNWGRYTVAATPTDNGTWVLMSVTFVESHGTSIAKAQTVLIRFTYGTGGGGGGGGLTEAAADARYLQLTGGTLSGNTLVQNLDVGRSATYGTNYSGFEVPTKGAMLMGTAGDANVYAVAYDAASGVILRPGSGASKQFSVKVDKVESTTPFVLPADPTNPLEAATKQYVDGRVVVGGSKPVSPPAGTIWVPSG